MTWPSPSTSPREMLEILGNELSVHPGELKNLPIHERFTPVPTSMDMAEGESQAIRGADH
jgi:hypothetical protein